MKRFTLSRTLRTVTVLVAALLVLNTNAFGQSRQIPAPTQEEPIVITGATIHPVNGDIIDSGYIRFENGVITDIGAGQPADDLTIGAGIFDASGMHVYPGLISSSSQLGLSEVQSVGVTNDHTELGRVKPEVRAAVAVNPDSDLIPVTRANGILTTCVFPQGGLISGRCSVIRLDGWTWENMAIDIEAGLVLNWPRTEPINAWWMNQSDEEQRRRIAEDLKAVEDIFDDAEAYVAARDNDPTMRTDQRYEAMRAALSGDKPIYVNANSAGQIESAVAWANRRGYSITILGGANADSVIPLLKEHEVPVIINGLHRLPSARHRHPEQIFELPNRLHEAGVTFCIASGEETAHERSLPYSASMAAAYGLPKDVALRSVTQSAAEILGVGDRIGSLEEGKAATIIVTTGDPLEIVTDTLVAFIDGRRIDLGNRQKTLYAKYQEKYRQLGLID